MRLMRWRVLEPGLAAVIAMLAVATACGGEMPKAASPTSTGSPVPTTTTTSGGSPSSTSSSPATAPRPSTSSSTTVADFPLTAVNWAAVAQRALGCGSFPAGLYQVRYVQPSANVREALVVANCRTGASTWPSGLFAYDSATSPKSAHLAQVLIDPGRETEDTSFEIVGSAITSRIAAFSSWSVPNCCPDLHYSVKWVWLDGLYVATPTNAVGPVPLTVRVSASPTVTHAGQVVTYSVKITNTGPQRITSVWMFVLPSSTNDRPSRCRGTTTCQLGDLSPGTSTDSSFSVKVTGAANPYTTTVGVNGVLPSGTVHASGTALIDPET